MRVETYLVLAMAASGGALIGVSPLRLGGAPAAATVRGCSITDGDTLRCGRERIRLLGIDAPELPGHCKGTRVCAPGDPWASTASLERAATGDLRITRVGEDHYGRTLAMVAGDYGDLSCWQLEHAQAIYKAKWDDGFRVARACPKAVAKG